MSSTLPVFYDHQPGPEIRRALNEMVAVFSDAIDNAYGPQGWSPVISIEADGVREVLKVIDWVGGEKSKPTLLGYVGPTGLVSSKSEAINVKGSPGLAGPANTLSIGTVSQGSAAATITGTAPNQTLNLTIPKGDTGPANTLSIGTVSQGSAAATITGTAPNQTLNLTIPKGDTGPAAWTPVFAVVADGQRFVQKVVDWTGGGGVKPATGMYVGPSGFTSEVANATNIRGAAGSGTGDVVGPSSSVSGSLAVFDGATGKLLKAEPISNVLDRSKHTGTQAIATVTGLQAALDAKAPINSPTFTGNVSGITASMVGLGLVSNLHDKDRTVGGFVIHDTRNIESLPSNVPSATGRFDFKFNANAGSPPNPANSNYSHVLTVNGWDADGTGGWPTQVSFGPSLNFRQGNSPSSWGPWKVVVDSSNYNDYAPSKTGVGATGTWGISISGNAATATNVSWSGVTSKPAFIAAGSDASSARAAIGALGASDIAGKVDKEAGKGLSSNDYTSAEKTKLAGIAANANNYVHPASHPPSIIVQDVNNRFVSDSEKATWNNKQPALVSGTNIKTLNGVSLLGAGNITIEVPDTNINNSITTNYANGRIEQITIDGITHHIFYNGEGRVSQVVYPYKGKTRTETFTYNTDGTFQGMTATEVSI